MTTCHLILANGINIPCHRWMQEGELWRLLSPPGNVPLLLIGENSGGGDLQKVLSPHGNEWICLPSCSFLTKDGHWVGCVVSNRDPAGHVENCTKHKGENL